MGQSTINLVISAIEKTCCVTRVVIIGSTEAYVSFMIFALLISFALSLGSNTNRVKVSYLVKGRAIYFLGD